MSKFNPKDVPSWCKWIAVDDNGAEWAYDSEPSHNNGYMVWVNDGDRARLLYYGKPPKNWKEELYTWE